MPLVAAHPHPPLPVLQAGVHRPPPQRRAVPQAARRRHRVGGHRAQPVLDRGEPQELPRAADVADLRGHRGEAEGLARAAPDALHAAGVAQQHVAAVQLPERQGRVEGLLFAADGGPLLAPQHHRRGAISAEPQRAVPCLEHRAGLGPRRRGELHPARLAVVAEHPGRAGQPARAVGAAEVAVGPPRAARELCLGEGRQGRGRGRPGQGVHRPPALMLSLGPEGLGLRFPPQALDVGRGRRPGRAGSGGAPAAAAPAPRPLWRSRADRRLRGCGRRGARAPRPARRRRGRLSRRGPSGSAPAPRADPGTSPPAPRCGTAPPPAASGSSQSRGSRRAPRCRGSGRR